MIILAKQKRREERIEEILATSLEGEGEQKRNREKESRKKEEEGRKRKRKNEIQPRRNIAWE